MTTDKGINMKNDIIYRDVRISGIVLKGNERISQRHMTVQITDGRTTLIARTSLRKMQNIIDDALTIEGVTVANGSLIMGVNEYFYLVHDVKLDRWQVARKAGA